MRRYETFTIFDPDLSEDGRSPVIERVKELITEHDGFLVQVDDWGNRKLAYEIKKKARGYYVRFDYCGDATLVNEMERFYRINDSVMKYMTVLLDKEIDLAKAKEEAAAIEAKRSQTEETQEATPAESETESAAATSDADDSEAVEAAETEDEPTAEQPPEQSPEETEEEIK